MLHEKAETLQKQEANITIQEKVEMHLQLLQSVWLHLNISDETLPAFSLAYAPVRLKPALGSIFCQAFDWIDAFLKVLKGGLA